MSVNIKAPLKLNSIRVLFVLSLFFLLLSNHPLAAAKGKKQKKKGVEYTMTVAAIRPAGNDEAFITVTFLESQRFYRLPKDADPGYLQLLRYSEKNQRPVLVKRVNEQSDVITSVSKK